MMEKDILSRVIEVEREIQEKLREEKRKSLEWLEGVRKEAEETLAVEEERLKEFYRETIADTMAEAERHGEEIARHATLESERLGRMSDEDLSKVLLSYMSGILPSDFSAEKRGKAEEHQ